MSAGQPEPAAASAAAVTGDEADDDPFSWLLPKEQAAAAEAAAAAPAADPSGGQGTSAADAGAGPSTGPRSEGSAAGSAGDERAVARPAAQQQPRPGSAIAKQAAFTTKRDRVRVQRAAKPQRTGPLNPFDMLEDGALDVESEDELRVPASAAARPQTPPAAAQPASHPRWWQQQPPPPPPRRSTHQGNSAADGAQAGGVAPTELSSPERTLWNGSIGGVMRTDGQAVCCLCEWRGM